MTLHWYGWLALVISVMSATVNVYVIIHSAWRGDVNRDYSPALLALNVTLAVALVLEGVGS